MVAAGLLGMEGDRVVMSHDRLLNWVVAKCLADRFEDGDVTEDELSKVLSRLTSHRAAWSQDFAALRLGYVPMDVFWLLAECIKPERLAAVIKRLTRERELSIWRRRPFQ